MKTVLIAAAVLSILAGSAAAQSQVDERTIPEKFHGEWNTTVTDCGTANNDSRLTISATEVQFYESGGAVRGAFRASQQEFDRGRLVFSDAFIARFEKLASDAMHEDDGLDPPDQSDVTMEVFKKAVSDLLAIARAEITPVELATKASA